MKKVILLVVAIVVMLGMVAYAEPLDFSGDFLYEIRAVTEPELKDLKSNDSFGSIWATLEGAVDDNNTMTVMVSNTMGNAILVDGIFLTTEWGFMTSKLGSIALYSAGYAVTVKEYESKTIGIAGSGATVSVPFGDFVFDAGKTLEANCEYGFKAGYTAGAIELAEVAYMGDNQIDDWKHSFAASVKVVSGDLSAGAGFTYQDALAYGVGAKYAFSPAWIAAGFGVEDDTMSIGADTGVDFDIWGAKVAVGFVEKFDNANIEAFYKIGEVTLTGGYDYNVTAADEVYTKVTASF